MVTVKGKVMIKRFCMPTHLDVLPKYSEWRCEHEDGTVQIWVQITDIVDEHTKPHWVRLGDMYEYAMLKDMNGLDIAALVALYLQ